MDRQYKNHYELRHDIHHRALTGCAKNKGRRYIGQKANRTAVENGRYQSLVLRKLSSVNHWRRCLNAVVLGMVASVSGLLLLWFVQHLSMASADLQVLHFTLPYAIGMCLIYYNDWGITLT